MKTDSISFPLCYLQYPTLNYSISHYPTLSSLLSVVSPLNFHSVFSLFSTCNGIFP